MIRPSFCAVSLALAAATLLARPAHACGGFFCGRSPIAQSGEHIVFTETDDPTYGTVTEAQVQIQYTGDPMKFAWVVPVHAKPTLDVGTSAFFTYLDTYTQPQFQLQFTGDQCFAFDAPTAGATDAGTAVGTQNGGGGVTVVSQQDVGPYDAAILQATDNTALTNWLRTNGYQIADQGAEALQPYLGPEYYFVALKLQAGQSVGSLRPIVLKMQGTTPCIPIQLTAIAAVSDMPIYAYFFAKGRTIPLNYREVVVNEARIDWLSGGYNYTNVVTAAVGEAGGHAFVTEYAEPTAMLAGEFHPADGLDTASLAGISDPVAFMQALIQEGFPTSGLLPLLEKYIPEPQDLVQQGVPETQFYNSIQYYAQDIQNDPGRAPFDPKDFANDLQTQIVAPLLHAESIVQNFPYVTRLFTTMSPIEMTIDPEFAVNTGLPDVSNIHTAKAECQAGSDGNVTITLNDGQTISESYNGGAPTDVPAAAMIQQDAPVGQPTIIRDNRTAVAKSGCSSTSSDLGLLSFAFAALLLWRRRRGLRA